jgi:hypothetical protein
MRLRRDRLFDDHRHVSDAVCDPRPLHADPDEMPTVRRAARDLERTLRALERYLLVHA